MSSSLLKQQAKECLWNLKDSVAEVLKSLPGELEQPRDVYKTLGIDRMIGWNIYKFYEADDCFVSVKHIPRKSAFLGFLRAAAKQGVPKTHLDCAKTQFQAFEDLIEVHAGDRPSMEMMLLAYSKEGTAQASLEHRKVAFTGNRFLYGLESDTRLTISLFEPTDSATNWKLTLLKGSFGLRRNRPDISWFYIKPKVFTEFEGTPHAPKSSPLVQSSSDNVKLPYYTQFCSCSLPTVSSSGAFVESVQDIFPKETGNAALMDLVFAEVIDLKGFDMNEDSSTSTRIITPCKLAAMDLIVPTSVVESTHFYPRMFSSILDDQNAYDDAIIDMASSILPVIPEFVTMPTIELATLEGVKNYGRIIEDVFKRRDLNPLNYTTIRTYVSFPVIPSNLDIAWYPRKSDIH